MRAGAEKGWIAGKKRDSTKRAAGEKDAGLNDQVSPSALVLSEMKRQNQLTWVPQQAQIRPLLQRRWPRVWSGLNFGPTRSGRLCRSWKELMLYPRKPGEQEERSDGLKEQVFGTSVIMADTSACNVAAVDYSAVSNITNTYFLATCFARRQARSSQAPSPCCSW